MNAHAQYVIDQFSTTPECLVIQDVGDHRTCPTITNDAEWVVYQLVHRDKLLPEGRRLMYRDSDGHLDEILLDGGRFVGYAPGPLPFDWADH